MINRWIASIFGRLLTVLHVIVVIGLLVYWLNALNSYGGAQVQTLITFAVFFGYVIIVGAITTLISMNETLVRIEKALSTRPTYNENGQDFFSRPAESGKTLPSEKPQKKKKKEKEVDWE